MHLSHRTQVSPGPHVSALDLSAMTRCRKQYYCSLQHSTAATQHALLTVDANLLHHSSMYRPLSRKPSGAVNTSVACGCLKLIRCCGEAIRVDWLSKLISHAALYAGQRCINATLADFANQGFRMPRYMPRCITQRIHAYVARRQWSQHVGSSKNLFV